MGMKLYAIGYFVRKVVSRGTSGSKASSLTSCRSGDADDTGNSDVVDAIDDLLDVRAHQCASSHRAIRNLNMAISGLRPMSVSLRCLQISKWQYHRITDLPELDQRGPTRLVPFDRVQNSLIPSIWKLNI